MAIENGKAKVKKFFIGSSLHGDVIILMHRGKHVEYTIKDGRYTIIGKEVSWSVTQSEFEDRFEIMWENQCQE